MQTLSRACVTAPLPGQLLRGAPIGMAQHEAYHSAQRAQVILAQRDQDVLERSQRIYGWVGLSQQLSKTLRELQDIWTLQTDVKQGALSIVIGCPVFRPFTSELLAKLLATPNEKCHCDATRDCLSSDQSRLPPQGGCPR